MSRKWAYKPRELTMKKIIKNMEVPSSDLMEKFLDLTSEYSKQARGRTMVLNDNKEIVFFVQLDERTYETKQVDVYVFDGQDYQPLSEEMSKKVSEAYFAYVDLMGEAYGTLEEEELS
jgi:hypothetical protein